MRSRDIERVERVLLLGTGVEGKIFVLGGGELLVGNVP
jgi:hypothetical protein